MELLGGGEDLNEDGRDGLVLIGDANMGIEP
jgi:hypothetical protein